MRSLIVYLLIFALVTGLLISLMDRTPEAPEACVAGDGAMQAGDYGQAIDYYLDCLDSEDLAESDMVAVYYVLANAYSAIGNHRQAVEDYGVVIDMDPGNAWAYNNRCWSYALLRQPHKALPDCEEAILRLPRQPAVLDSRALVYWQLGEKEKARDDLAEAHRLDKDLPNPAARLKEFEEMFPN